MKDQSLSKPFLIRLINPKLFTIVFSSSTLLLKNGGLHLGSTKPLPGSTITYSYHDYFHAWFKLMLPQDATMIHSWFVNFDKNFNSQLPLWFIHWRTQFGPVNDIFPGPLTLQVLYKCL